MEINFNDYFYYDETSQSCLRWKVDRRGGRGRGHIIVSCGDVAGCLNGLGYWVVSCNNRRYLAHRIVLSVNGIDCSGWQVDHINQNRADNRVINLRLVNNATNHKNRSKQSNNKTGVNGVTLQTITYKEGVVYKYFVANWVDATGKNKQKCFSVNKLGQESAFMLACEHRDKVISELISCGEGYTNLHGT